MQTLVLTARTACGYAQWMQSNQKNQRPEGCEAACPACPHRDLTHAESEAQKEGWVRQLLAPHPVESILSPHQRWGYRRKALLHARYLNGWQFGLLKKVGWEEELVPIPHCPLHRPEVNAQLATIKTLVPADCPLVYVLVSGSALTLVLKGKRDPRWVALFSSWNLSSFFVNWNPVAGKRVMDSRQMEKISGEDYFFDDGVIYGPTSFRQQIPGLENYVIAASSEFFASHKTLPILDLYCGIGASLKQWEREGRFALGVELYGESIRCAEKNAPTAKLLRGRVEDRLPQVEEYFSQKKYLAFTNPPRTGHEKAALEWIKKNRPEKMAYLSCNPKTLARDLAFLGEGFRVGKIQPLDFFPQTKHVETLAFLEKI